MGEVKKEKRLVKRACERKRTERREGKGQGDNCPQHLQSLSSIFLKWLQSLPVSWRM